MPSAIPDLIQLMHWAADQGLRCMVHDDGRTRVEIKRAMPGDAPVQVPQGAARVVGTDRNLQPDAGIVRAPLAGICHLTPESDKPPFVTPGARIAAGQTLCLIEAMKVMTAVPAPVGGTLADVLVQTGAMVALEDTLFRIVP